MRKYTTIAIGALLRQAKVALGSQTTQAMIQEALRRTTDQAASATDRAARQRRSFNRCARHVDSTVLKSEEMW